MDQQFFDNMRELASKNPTADYNDFRAKWEGKWYTFTLEEFVDFIKAGTEE